VKYASAAMKKTNPTRGKNFSGGSIILTASGMHLSSLRSYYYVYASFLLVVAGLRSGAGSVDCTLSDICIMKVQSILTFFYRQR